MTDQNTLGDGPVDEKFREKMVFLAQQLDEVFNGQLKGNDKHTGFLLMVFPFDGHEGRANYISNADRNDVVTLLKEQVARFEGQAEMSGTA